MPGKDMGMDRLSKMIAALNARIEWGKEKGYYFYLQPVENLDGVHALVNGREMLMFASYSYLSLIGHPRINAAARAAIDEFGTGTHGVRMLAGTNRIHNELEKKIASFNGAEAAIVFSSGYVTNLATISTLVGKNELIICDKLNHASIVDGCMLSGAKFVRFKHNDMTDLEKYLAEERPKGRKLVVVDAVFSMDGDIVNLPDLHRLSRKYGAMLMVDEAHSLGVLGETGHGIEEHFGLKNAVDVMMGTLSKTIPSVGGYIAADRDIITYLKHTARAFVFSAALPPPATAAALASFEVIEEEPERLAALKRNIRHFLGGLKARGLDTMQSETAIVPIVCGDDKKALLMTKLVQEKGILALPVLSPAVPPGTSRIRAAVNAGHSEEEINRALDIFAEAGRAIKVI